MVGKRAVVIGGSSGIGLSIAEAFVAEQAVVEVVGRDRSRCEEARAHLLSVGADAHVTSFAADVRDELGLQSALDHAVADFGGITTLVYAAGIGMTQRVSATTESDWREIIDINVTGAWRAARLSFPLLRESGGGSVITIGSDAGLQLERRLGAYSVSKAALIALTKELALDGAADQIRVNCICPGYVSPGMRRFPDLLAAEGFIEPLPPIGRIGTGADIAAACVFLASDPAGFITGAVLSVDGGFTAGLAN